MIYVLAQTFSCGGLSGIPTPVANLVSIIINGIKIFVPVVLIVLGMIDMFKAMTKQKDDEMKKAQTLFLKRIIAALLVFFVVTIVQFAFSLLANTLGDSEFLDCINYFVNGV